MERFDGNYWTVIAVIGLAISLGSMFVLSLGEQFAISVVESNPISLIEFIYIHLGLMSLGGVLIVMSIIMHESIGYRETAEQLEKQYFEDIE